MRVFALSDVHIDYAANKRWMLELSDSEYRDDVLILAGDVTDDLDALAECLQGLASKFARVLFVPGNHELWVVRDHFATSLDKFHAVIELARDCGATTDTWRCDGVTIVPLFSWYDFSFGQPGKRLKKAWTDFVACVWPEGYTVAEVARYFSNRNHDRLDERNDVVISFSHFLPRIDVMPESIPARKRYLYPVLGSDLLGDQLRVLKPTLHVYGHSHVHRQVSLDGIQYVNNAFGYPSETRISRKDLLCIHEA